MRSLLPYIRRPRFIDRAIIILLSLYAFLVRLYVARLDPFLHAPDERFHALVARNMMSDPFKPMLVRNPVFPYDPIDWLTGTIWLHKPPLFLWQIAISMRLFGVNEMALRLPSIIMGTLMVAIIYRVAFLATASRIIAVLSAILMCCSHFQIELTSGYYNTDHNDVAFGFYIITSFWAYAEFSVSGKANWVILIGLFAGLAVMCKWLTGLLIFPCWLSAHLFSERKWITRLWLQHFTIAAIIALLVFLPWQIYIYHRFPLQAKYVAAFFNRHLTEVVERNGAARSYYFRKIPDYFGPVIWISLPIGLLISVYDKRFNRRITIAMAAAVIFIFVVFTLLPTKMPAYPFVVAPFGFIMMGIAANKIVGYFKKSRPVIRAAAAVAFAWYSLSYAQIRADHGKNNRIWTINAQHADVYRNLASVLPGYIHIVVHTPRFEDIRLMFYNPTITAYSREIKKEWLDSLANYKVPVAAFAWDGKDSLPEAIRKYQYLSIINAQFKY